jgi:hypothetical protein
MPMPTHGIAMYMKNNICWYRQNIHEEEFMTMRGKIEMICKITEVEQDCGRA